MIDFVLTNHLSVSLTVTAFVNNSWDTSVGPFIFEDQYIQISTQPPSAYVYGFGEHEHKSLKHNLSAWGVLPIFARRQHPFVSDSGSKIFKFKFLREFPDASVSSKP